jgi:hypothetical protein
MLINGMKLDVLILKLVRIDSFILIVLDINFRKLKKTSEDFQTSWYKMFNWLKYFEEKYAAYCLAYFVYAKKPIDDLEVMHLLLKDFMIGKKLMMIRIILFWSI